MEIILYIIRSFVIFIAASGFILGQLFFGSFSLGATAAGSFGVVAAILGGKFSASSITRVYIVIIFCVASIIAILFSAYNYYANLNIPGNNFGWHLKVPYIASLIFIGWSAIKNHLTNSSS